MIRPKKHLGQHFLRDENIARKIIRSLSGKYPNIIEIGAGTGILSKYLLQDKNLNPFFFEIDEESIHFLTKKFPEISDKLIFSDFLEYDGYRSCVPVVICNSQRDPFPLLVDPDYDKLARLCLSGNMRSLNVHEFSHITEDLFIQNLVHALPPSCNLRLEFRKNLRQRYG